MLELIFQGFLEWTYGLILECWEYFSSVLFDLMSLDFAYLETHMPIITTIRQIMLGVGWALLLGNCGSLCRISQDRAGSYAV